MQYLIKYESYSDWLSQLDTSKILALIDKKSKEIIDALKVHLEDDLNIHSIEYQKSTNIDTRIRLIASKLNLDNILPVTFEIKTTNITDEISSLIRKYTEYLDDIITTDDSIDKLYEKILDKITKYIKPLIDKFSKKYELPIVLDNIELSTPMAGHDITIYLDLNINLNEIPKKYNESITSFNLPDILKLNLEDNPYFSVVDILVDVIVDVPTVHPDARLRNFKKFQWVIITEIFGEDSLLWKQTYNGVSADKLSLPDLKDKIYFINRRILLTIAKKYDFTIAESKFLLTYSSQHGRDGQPDQVECKFKILT